MSILARSGLNIVDERLDNLVRFWSLLFLLLVLGVEDGSDDNEGNESSGSVNSVVMSDLTGFDLACEAEVLNFLGFEALIEPFLHVTNGAIKLFFEMSIDGAESPLVLIIDFLNSLP